MQKPQENWQLRHGRFVLLRARGTPCPPQVSEALSDVRPRVREVHDPLSALAELCAFDRADEPLRRNGIESVESTALLVIDPGALEQLPELYAAIQRFLPEVTIIPVETTGDGVIFFDIGGVEGALTGLETSGGPTPPQTPAPPYLRFTGDPDPSVPGPESTSGSPETAEAEHMREESPSDSNPEDPPQRTLTDEERERLHGRVDPDPGSPGNGVE